MARKNTHAYINQLLRVIGENGLSGIKIPSDSITDAMATLQSHSSSELLISSPRLAAELRRQDLVSITKESDHVRFQLSVKGVHRLQLAEVRAITIPPQIPWDKKWRMVLFDIPSRRAESRYLLTSELKRLGFVMLQSSTWFHPYPCFAQVSALIQYANLQPFITLAEVSSIDMRSQQQLLTHYPELDR